MQKHRAENAAWTAALLAMMCAAAHGSTPEWSGALANFFSPGAFQMPFSDQLPGALPERESGHGAAEPSPSPPILTASPTPRPPAPASPASKAWNSFYNTSQPSSAGQTSSQAGPQAGSSPSQREAQESQGAPAPTPSAEVGVSQHAASPSQALSAPALPAPAPKDAFLHEIQETAVKATLRVSGEGVEPFDSPKRTSLEDALAAVMPGVAAGSARVLRVTPAVSFRRRSLQREIAPVPGVVDVLVELDGAGPGAPATIQQELRGVIANGMLGAALGARGGSAWGVQLLSAEAATPTPRDAAVDPCTTRYWHLCLDGTGLTPAALKGIVAGGGGLLLVALAVVCVMRDIVARADREAEASLNLGMPGGEGTPAEAAALKRPARERKGAIQMCAACTPRSTRPCPELGGLRAAT